MEEPAPPSMKRRVVVSLIVVVVALGGGHLLLKALAGLRKPPARAPGGPPLPVVRVVEVRQQDYQEILRGYGVARARREARVSAQVGGVVLAVAPELEAGTLVVPPPGGLDGTGPPAPAVLPLVRIDPKDLEDALARLRAERQQARADRARIEADLRNLASQLEVAERRLDTARSELRRILSLVPDTLPESDADRQRLAVFALEQMQAELVTRRDDAAAQIDVADARLAVIDASERKAERDLERTRVWAPFAGRVVARHVEVGALVAPGTPLFDLVDTARVEVAIALPASRYGHVRTPGAAAGASRVTLRLGEAGPPVWEGTVGRVDPRIDTDARTFRVYVEIAGAAGESPVPPGAHVVGDVQGTLHAGVLPVPREAFLDEIVYVAERTDPEAPAVARKRRPRVRQQLVGMALVEAGDGEDDLRDGDRVVVSNLEDVADGSRVRLLETSGGDEGP